MLSVLEHKHISVDDSIGLQLGQGSFQRCFMGSQLGTLMHLW